MRHMRKITDFTLLLLLAVVLLPTSAAFARNGRPVRPGRLTFPNPYGGGTCTAIFSRTARGIVNERDLSCSSGPQNPWALANVHIQYRPLEHRPHAECEPYGLVTSQTPWSTTDRRLTRDYFESGEPYSMCVYLVHPIIAFGELDVDSIDGTTTPVIPLSGKYHVCISGVYDTGLVYADAKYTSRDQFQTPGTDDVTNSLLGFRYGEVQVNGEFVDWGPYRDFHTYCRVIESTGDSFNVRVFDAADGTEPLDFWYFDNTNINMRYMIIYFGQ